MAEQEEGKSGEDKDKEKDKEKEKPLVLYIGTDRHYWQNLLGRFDTGVPESAYRFDDIPLDAPCYLDVFFRIVEDVPSIVYVDFTGVGKEALRLTQLLVQDGILKTAPLIGLVADKKDARRCLSLGMDIVHVKCGEFHDVVYDATYLFSQRNAISKPFAKAKIKDMDIDLIDDFKVGFITSKYVHIEGNLRLEKEEVVSLDVDVPRQIVPSKKFIVRKVYTSGIYYGFQYAYDLDFVYVDKPDNEDLYSEEKAILESEETPEEDKGNIRKDFETKRKQRQVDYEEHMRVSKKRIDKWILQNSYSSMSKFVRVLVIDERLAVLRQEEARSYFEAGPFSVRFLTGLDGELKLLDSFRPELIYIEHSVLDIQSLREEGKDEEEVFETASKFITTGNERVQNCIEKIKTIDDYDPFIVVFNCVNMSEQFDPESWPDVGGISISFDYPRCMTRKDGMTRDAIVEMAECYDKKQKELRQRKTAEKVAALKKKDPVKYGRLTPEGIEEKRYYISRDNPLSLAAMHHGAQLLGLSESDVEIGITRELSMGCYRIDSPVSISVRLVPAKDKDFEEKGGYENLQRSYPLRR